MTAVVQGFAQGALASMRAAAAAAETQNRVSTNGVLPVDKGAVRKSKHDCGEYRQGRQWRSKDFVEAPLLDSVVAQYGVNTEAFVPAYWRAGPLVYGQEERSALSTTLEIGVFILDTADAGLDIQFVGQLLGSGHFGYAGLLTATTVTGFLANVFFVRPFMRWHPHPREKSPAITLMFIGAEIFLFFVEDATTMFIWSRTSTFSNDTGSIANMIATLASALITACAVLYAGWTFLRPECESGAICDMSKHPYLLPMWVFLLPFVGVFLSVVGIAYVGIDVLIPAALDDEGRFLSEDGFVDGPAAVSGVVDDVFVASCILGWLVGLGYFAGLLTQFYVDKAGMRFMMVEDKASPRSLKSLCAWFHCLPSLPEGYSKMYAEL